MVSEVEEQNKEIVREFFRAIDAGDFSKLKELAAEDLSINVAGLPEPWDVDMFFQAIETHYAAFPDWIHVIEDVIAEGDKVVVKLNQNGTHQSEFEGIPATGTRATLPAMHLATIVDGKIKDWFAIEDYLGLYVQLGMELKPKGNESLDSAS
jgi:steroid delta-isomerase-like uncharacterized protein